MPKKAMDYSKTIIYKIVCKDLDIRDAYVGHTTNWIKRKSAHKKNCNNQNSKNYNFNIYKFIRENGNWDNWEMIEIKKYPCNDKREAEAEERRYYEELNANLNRYIPYTTNEEKKEQAIKRTKNWRVKNEDKMKENNKNYYKNNKEEINQKNKNYKDNNKDKISNDRKIKIQCQCGSIVRKSDISRHLKSKKHINYINNLNNNI